eukprot:TRINITY_DN357_c0_g1_i2.p1 TRINITY_DN357_c0_g1~~TRINITY_DN357_c0_g1_i2.p1  ORF type:complete len:1000 (-),score=346.31 TRINITY_DN357_c0_g1_i2:45-2993(-)
MSGAEAAAAAAAAHSGSAAQLLVLRRAASTRALKPKTWVIQEEAGSKHTYSVEEKAGLVDHINAALAEDPDITKGNLPYAHLPIDPKSDEIFDCLRDGIILGKFINTFPDAPRVPLIIKSKDTMNPFEMQENLTRARKSAIVILPFGASTMVDVPALAVGKPAHLILGLLWQLVAYDLDRQVKVMLANHDISILLGEKEAENVLDDLPAEDILLRWFNFHLANAKHPDRVTNFSSDLKDSVKYLVLLHQLEPEKCTLRALKDQDLRKRAKGVIRQAKKIGCNKFINPDDIVAGIARLNFAFVAHLFSKYPCMAKLDLISEDVKQQLQEIEATAAEAAAAAAEKLKEVQAKQEELQKSVGAAEGTKAELARKTAHYERKYEKVTEKLSTSVDSLKKEHKSLVENHQKEEEDLLQRIKEAEGLSASDSPLLKMTSDALKTEIKKSKVVREQMLAENVDLMNEHHDLTKEFQVIHKETDEARKRHDEADAALQKAINRTSHREAKLRHEIQNCDVDGLNEKIATHDQTNIQLDTDIQHLTQEKIRMDRELVTHQDKAKSLQEISNNLFDQITKLQEDQENSKQHQAEHLNKSKKYDRKAIRVAQKTEEVKYETNDVKRETELAGEMHEELLDQESELQHRLYLSSITRDELADDVDERENAEMLAKAEQDHEVYLAQHQAHMELDLVKNKQAVEKKRLLLQRQQKSEQLREVEAELALESQDARAALREQNTLELTAAERRRELATAKREREEADADLQDAEEEAGAAREEAEITKSKAQTMAVKTKFLERQVKMAREEESNLEVENKRLESGIQLQRSEVDSATMEAEEAVMATNRANIAKRQYQGEESEMAKKMTEQDLDRAVRKQAIEEQNNEEIAKEKQKTAAEKAKKAKELETLDAKVAEVTENLEVAEKTKEEQQLRKTQANLDAKLNLTKLESSSTANAQVREQAQALLATLNDASRLLKKNSAVKARSFRTRPPNKI